VDQHQPTDSPISISSSPGPGSSSRRGGTARSPMPRPASRGPCPPRRSRSAATRSCRCAAPSICVRRPRRCATASPSTRRIAGRGRIGECTRSGKGGAAASPDSSPSRAVRDVWSGPSG
jgi:hypothetical protein